MATRSTIAVMHPDGSISSIYCHWDGYLKHHGKILTENYSSYEKAAYLVTLGSLSVLAESPDPLPEAPARHDPEKTLKRHSFDRPQNGVCVAYHRDRNELTPQINHYPNLQAYTSSRSTKEGYDYLFMDEKWHIEHETRGLIPVTARMIETDSIDEVVESEDVY